jgi:signal transduction histidine kinase/CheY-like chemotaxis protein
VTDGKLVDWSLSSLRPAATWPPPLRTAIEICLASPYPSMVSWGPRFTLFYNDAFWRVLGYEQDPGWLGQPAPDASRELWELIGPALEGVRATGKAAATRELVIPQRAGYGPAMSRFRISCAPIHLEPDAAGGVFCTCEAAMELASGPSLYRYLTTLAHDLRNRLAPIRNAVEMMRLIEVTEPRLRWSRDVIDRQIRQLASWVNDFCDAWRILQGDVTLQKRQVALAEILDAAIGANQPFIDSRRLLVSVHLLQEPIWVDGDVSRLVQAVKNLLMHLAGRVPEGGDIVVTAEEGEAEVSIRLCDSGPPIPRDLLARLFDPLARAAPSSSDRSYGGFSIDISVAQRLVELHGGTIEELSGNAGNTFLIRLPRLVHGRTNGLPEALEGSSSESATHRPEPAPQPPRGQPRRVLLVDDNEAVANSLAMLLAEMGHQVQVAEDGATALEKARLWKPDIVMLDLRLPGVDGYEVARQLRRDTHPQTLQLFAMSAYDPDEERLRAARAAGFDDYICKLTADGQTLAALLGASGGAPLARSLPVSDKPLAPLPAGPRPRSSR